MDSRDVKPYFNLIGVFFVFALLLAFTVDVSLTNKSGIAQELPRFVGTDWTGDQILYCHNSQCRREYLASELHGNIEVCPECGGKLMSISPVEYSILPKDTYITRKLYKNAVTGDGLFVALVMSGADRSSIHRPQVCLVGQGNEILGQHVEEVPMTGRDDLGVMVIDMMRPYARNSSQQGKYPSFYAYWFVGKDRETPYHVERMFWMAYDRIVKNVSHRWSYISISGSGKYAAKKETVDAFVADFYPQITRDPRLMSHE